GILFPPALLLDSGVPRGLLTPAFGLLVSSFRLFGATSRFLGCLVRLRFAPLPFAVPARGEITHRATAVKLLARGLKVHEVVAASFVDVYPLALNDGFNGFDSVQEIHEETDPHDLLRICEPLPSHADS